MFGTVRQSADGDALERAGVCAVRMDVTDPESIARARRDVEQRLGAVPLGGLVNNAGVPAVGPLELIPLADVRAVLEVNVMGAIAVTQAFLPLLKAARGRIVNISSVAGRLALPFMAPYAASKFALEAISDGLRREVRPFGVRVIVVEPGSFRTRIWDKAAAMDVGRYTASAYGPAFARFAGAALRGAKRAPPPDKVVRAVRRALTARRPPLRMIVTARGLIDQYTLWLPARWLDTLIERYLSKGSLTPLPVAPGDSGRASPPRSAPHSPGS